MTKEASIVYFGMECIEFEARAVDICDEALGACVSSPSLLLLQHRNLYITPAGKISKF